MNDLQTQFDKEMLIDTLIELANKYAHKFPETATKIINLAMELRNNISQTKKEELHA